MGSTRVETSRALIERLEDMPFEEIIDSEYNRFCKSIPESCSDEEARVIFDQCVQPWICQYGGSVYTEKLISKAMTFSTWVFLVAGVGLGYLLAKLL